MTATLTRPTPTVAPEIVVVTVPVGDREGLVRISKRYYCVELQGSLDDATFTKDDGTSYTVSCWGTQRGNQSCTCADWRYRKTAAQRACKHIAALAAIRELYAPKETPRELTMADLFALVWEE